MAKKESKKKKKKSMQKQVETEELQEGEQMDLIDVAPENAKEIIKLAKQYKAVQRKRMAALEAETKLKQKLLDAIHESGIKPVDNEGKIKFTYDHFTITVTPRDELIKVKDMEESE